jgi:hypothetical protein
MVPSQQGGSRDGGVRVSAIGPPTASLPVCWPRCLWYLVRLKTAAVQVEAGAAAVTPRRWRTDTQRSSATSNPWAPCAEGW